jgi:hypothetical protein
MAILRRQKELNSDNNSTQFNAIVQSVALPYLTPVVSSTGSATCLSDNCKTHKCLQTEEHLNDNTSTLN